MFKDLRLKFFTLLAVALIALLWYLSPAQIPLIIHKFSQVTLAAVLGYWLDRHIFPESRPSKTYAWRNATHQTAVIASAAMLRRAIIVGATIVAVAIAI